MEINCVGRRRLKISKVDDKIAITILWKDRQLANILLLKDDCIKLIGELNGCVRFDPSQK